MKIRYVTQARHKRELTTCGVVLSFALVLLLLSACSGSKSEGPLRFGSTNDQAIAPGDPGIVHVHGLGINPADQTLYAATHTGLFQIVNGQATRVGGNYQDTMGFTVIGPDLFLGSGHPDAQAYSSGKLPPLLGLIQSQNSGRIWESIALLGKSDFHTLRTAHGIIYGYDSSNQAFMTSPDQGKTWQANSKLLLYDFAVSPQDPNRIIGTNATALLVSSDRGKSWQPMQGSAFLLLGWSNPDRLWGLDRGGRLYLSNTGGSSWEEQGSVGGSPEAFLDTGTSLFVAVSARGIYSSQDGGHTWQLFYRSF